MDGAPMWWLNVPVCLLPYLRRLTCCDLEGCWSRQATFLIWVMLRLIHTVIYAPRMSGSLGSAAKNRQLMLPACGKCLATCVITTWPISLHIASPFTVPTPP